LIRNTTHADIASVHVLLTARRIPVLLEEVEPFIDQYLKRQECSSPVASSAVTRAICVYGIMVAQIIYSYHNDRPDDYLDTLRARLLATLLAEPSEVVSVGAVTPTVPFLDNERVDLQTRLALATYQVVGKSGYTHATLSRIARRAECSTGAIYGLYSSKERLVADSYHLAIQRRWSQPTNFTGILDEGALTQLLFETGHPMNATWCNYLLEFSLATAFNPVLLETISYHTSGVSKMIPLLQGLTDDERLVLSDVVTMISLLTHGLSYVSAVCGSLECSNFDQFAEPLRTAFLSNVGATWDRLFEQINLFAEQLNT
jgi:AcrR family transcriptional regulator